WFILSKNLPQSRPVMFGHSPDHPHKLVGKGYLVTEAVAHYRQNQVQLPYKLMRMIWRMSEHDRSALWEIFRKYEPKDNEMKHHQMIKSNPVYAGA
ncbi:MAG: hypothetical protein RLN82_02745, partial [Pseudomonadales bacterium]